MNILALNCDTSASLSVFLIFKTAFQIILSGVPIIMVIFSSIDLSKAIIKSEADKDVYKNFIKKIVAFILIFLIMPITNVVLSVIDEENFDKTNCWVMANRQYINRLKEKEQEQRDAEADLRASEMAEKLLELEKENNVNIPGGSTGTAGGINNSKVAGEKICTNFVSSDSSKETISTEILSMENLRNLNNAKSDFEIIKIVYPDIKAENLSDFAKSMSSKCVDAIIRKETGIFSTPNIEVGDVVLYSGYDSEGKCTYCNSNFENRCNNWNCVVEAKIVTAKTDVYLSPGSRHYYNRSFIGFNGTSNYNCNEEIADGVNGQKKCPTLYPNSGIMMVVRPYA